MLLLLLGGAALCCSADEESADFCVDAGGLSGARTVSVCVCVQTWTTDGELSSKGVLAKLTAKYKHSSGKQPEHGGPHHSLRQ